MNKEDEEILEIFFDNEKHRRILVLLGLGKSSEEVVDSLLREFEFS